MRKYQFYIYTDNYSDKNAGSKATADCSYILNRRNYEDLQIHLKNVEKSPLYNFLKAIFLIVKVLFKIKGKSFVVVQYPVKGIGSYLWLYLSVFKLKKIKLCGIIHDIDYLRNLGKGLSIELKNLQAFDYLISHNADMTKWLKQCHYNGSIVDLEVFDYLLDDSEPERAQNRLINENRRVAFAGSFSKSPFVHELGKLNLKADFLLYGEIPDLSILNNTETEIRKGASVYWKGAYSPVQLTKEIDADFGLVWDGNSLSDCNDAMGKYLQYNNPHKLSLYLVSGLPVIVPKNSASAKFVIKNNLGYVIDSLYELENVINIDSEEYNKIKENVKQICRLIRSGHYLDTALNIIEYNLDENNNF